MLDVAHALALAAGEAEVEFLHVVVGEQLFGRPSMTIRPFSMMYP